MSYETFGLIGGLLAFVMVGGVAWLTVRSM